MQTFITKVEKLGIPAGSHVTFDDDPKKDNRGTTGKLLCTIPTGGGLFFAEDELTEV